MEKIYNNRELSWLDFNSRVLSEAKNKHIPLLERMKFLSITASNLDEFYMIRVASLRDMVSLNYDKQDFSGLTPKQQLKCINEKTHEFVNSQYSTYNRSLLPLLKNEGFIILEHHEDLNEEQIKYVDNYFENNLYPVLTPMAVDSSRPFPLIRNKSLNIAALLEKSKSKQKNTDYEFATVQVPSVLPRFIEIPSNEGKIVTVILLEEIIERHIQKLFLNYNVVCAFPYRVMRNADLTIDEEDAADLLKEIQKQLKKRQWGEVIRLDVEDKIDDKLLGILKRELSINDDDIFKVNGPVDLTFLMKLYGVEGFEHLKEEKYIPVQSPDVNIDENIFDQIGKKDILLHHPYDSFDPVMEFVRQASVDPKVLAIKQTLYRVSGNSPIIKYLAQAADNGKQVSVLVELKARFDEENNINWAKQLEKAGCHVIYGLKGLKTHSKITLVVREENEGIKRYVHLGTGNYNDATAKLYTDMGMFTAKNAIGEDATAVFNMLSGYSEPENWNKLVLAPLWLREKFEFLIEREIAKVKEGKEGHIIAKMNSLCDQEMTDLLYKASQKGVKVDLIIRGICSLRGSVPGLSDNITVRSIVGKFLEHSRIYYFLNGGNEEIYMGSADMMPRNLDKRVEILFPVEDEKIKSDIKEILNIQMEDTDKTHIMNSDGVYERIDKRGKRALNSQEYFIDQAKERRNNSVIRSERKFTPLSGI